MPFVENCFEIFRQKFTNPIDAKKGNEHNGLVSRHLSSKKANLGNKSNSPLFIYKRIAAKFGSKSINQKERALFPENCFSPYLSASEIPFIGLNSFEKNLITNLLGVFTKLTLITGEDEFIAAGLKTFIKKANQIEEEIFELLEGQSSIPPCVCLSGFFQNYGIGTNKDYELAFKRYRFAADLGNVFAQTQTGYCYRQGLGIKANLEKSLEYIQKSAVNGEIHGQLNLAYYYFKGYGVLKDEHKAFQIYQKAAETKYPGALRSLAVCYRNGFGVPLDETRAFQLYKESAEGGNPTSKNDLGWSYLNNLGTRKDLLKAVFWFRKAALDESKCGAFNTARCYQGGLGVPLDLHKAIRYYSKGNKYRPYTCDQALKILFKTIEAT
ncbi:hypothetical protein G9A89_021743 [Geosiphon pyriformis]|nr:hypothetical protein G9A89_021743 [Geosiphon pyriformis]